MLLKVIPLALSRSFVFCAGRVFFFFSKRSLSRRVEDFEESICPCVVAREACRHVNLQARVRNPGPAIIRDVIVNIVSIDYVLSWFIFGGSVWLFILFCVNRKPYFLQYLVFVLNAGKTGRFNIFTVCLEGLAGNPIWQTRQAISVVTDVKHYGGKQRDAVTRSLDTMWNQLFFFLKEKKKTFVSHQVGAYPGFCSLKHRSISTPPWMEC